MLPYTPEERDFYSTDVFSDKAIAFLDEQGTSEQPFFLYLAECAPHFPMHAWPEDIARVGDRYRIGWDELRRRRAARLQEEGLAEPRWGVSPRDDRAPAWDDEPDQAGRAYAMAVYAAMVERMDFAIGRVLDKIRARRQRAGYAGAVPVRQRRRAHRPFTTPQTCPPARSTPITPSMRRGPTPATRRSDCTRCSTTRAASRRR